ncbi:hypothetical protein MBLNU459_g8529t1 [Dothideomycetes sp. NU459]
MSSFYTSSPTVVLPMQQALPDQYFHDCHYRSAIQQSPSGLPNGSFNTSLAPNSLPPTPSAGAIAGRKRSRGDNFSPEDDQEGNATAPVKPVPVNRGDPVYGPGMTLIYPNDPSGHYNRDPSTEPGTWLEQRAEEAVNAVKDDRRPIMPSRKSQRLGAAATAVDNITPLAQTDCAKRSNTAEPFIDEVTRLLGISWMRMDGSEGIQVRRKAYTRLIERHYPGLANVELWFENTSIQGYLGTALNKATGLQEFLLWSDDLKQAVLVTREPSELILKLGQPQTLVSSATESMFASSEAAVEEPIVNGTAPSPFTLAPVAQGVDMEMD